MTDEKTVQCPACTADLPPGTIECPWCGHVMAPKPDESLPTPTPPAPARVPSPAVPTPPEPAEVPLPTEPAQPREPKVALTPAAEPGLSEIPLGSKKAPASSLKVMGIVLTIFSFLALVFFVFQVLDGRFTRLVLLLPIIGMIIGLISMAVGQKR